MKIPVTRTEQLINAIVESEASPVSAVTRVEQYLDNILNNVASTLVPVTRVEAYLAKISGASVDIPTPVTRIEKYLAAIAGEDIEPPVPVTRLEYFLADWAAAGGASLETVTGNAPVTLLNAVARAIVSLTQTGLCTQADTPTPSAPVNIKCNNGALKMVDDELPDGYKRVLGFQCNDNAMWQITDFKLRGSDTVKISFSIAAACNVFGCYQGASATDNYDLYASITSGSKYFRYGAGTYLSYFSNDNLNQRFDVTYTPTGSQGMPQDSTWSALTFESANDLLLGSTTVTGTSARLKGKLFGDFIVENGGAERLHLVPCERLSDNVLGYYDIVGEAFYEPYEGFDGAVSLGYDGSHYVLRTVGTPEVLTVGGKNLNAGTLDSVGYTSTGAESTSSTFVGTLCKIPCAEGEKYTVSFGGFTTSGISGVFINTWKTDGTFNSRQAIASSGETTYTIPTGVGMVNFTLYKTGGATIDDGAWMQVELGTSATPYEPYIAPQNASVVNLLSVDSLADTQDIISGTVARKCGVWVLTGEENWTVASTNDNVYYIGSTYIPSDYGAVSGFTPICSHLSGVISTNSITSMTANTIKTNNSSKIVYACVGATYTKEEWKAFIAAQYAAGTPVIIIYPLAEETTESVAGQSLNTAVGTNVVSVTAEVSPIALEVDYYAKSA